MTTTQILTMRSRFPAEKAFTTPTTQFFPSTHITPPLAPSAQPPRPRFAPIVYREVEKKSSTNLRSKIPLKKNLTTIKKMFKILSQISTKEPNMPEIHTIRCETCKKIVLVLILEPMEYTIEELSPAIEHIMDLHNHNFKNEEEHNQHGYKH